MVHRRVSGDFESEPLDLDTDDPRVVVIELDDGGSLELDRRELWSALEEAPRPQVGWQRRALHR
jgi:hypothetical protein